MYVYALNVLYKYNNYNNNNSILNFCTWFCFFFARFDDELCFAGLILSNGDEEVGGVVVVFFLNI